MRREVKIPVHDGEMPGYRAKPKRGSGLATVLVVQEIFGVHEHIRDLCRRLAKQGYLAVAPELYARQGDVSKMTDIQEIISKVVSKVPDEQVMSDLDAAAALGRSRPRRATAPSSASPASAGAAASPGSTPRTTRAQGGAPHGTAGWSAPRTRCSPKNPIEWRRRSRRRCWACTAARTRASRSTPSSGCAPRSRPPATRRRSWSIPTRGTPSTPTTAPATAKARRGRLEAHAGLVQALRPLMPRPT